MVRMFGAILLSVFILQIFSSQLIFTGFLVNRNFIAHELCVKKAEANNHCQGKCHLKKEIEKDNERQSGNKQLPKIADEILFVEDGETFNLIDFSESDSDYFLDSPSSITTGFLRGIFHPPSLA